MKSTKSYLALKAAASLLILLFAAEVGVRLSGIADFPIYSSDDQIGYCLRPNQSGKFLNRNHWFVNDRGMATAAPWNPAGHRNILILGNSIVYGGNPYDQKDKLAPTMQRELAAGDILWPIAAGGWTNVNEVAYLERNPDVVQSANFFVWEYMVGGLGGLARWHNEYGFPRTHPLWATGFVCRRYVLPQFINIDMNELPPTGAPMASNSQRFEAAIGKLNTAIGSTTPGILFLFPGEGQFLAARRGEEWLPERAEVERIARRYGLKLVDVSRSPEWHEGLYRDGTHPTVEGNKVLARILTSAIKQVLGCEKGNPVKRPAEDIYLPLPKNATEVLPCAA